MHDISHSSQPTNQTQDAQWTVSLVIAAGHYNFPTIVFVDMNRLTYTYTTLMVTSYDYTLYILCLKITRAGIRPHVKWAVKLVISDGHFNLSQGFVWVCVD